MAKKRKEKEAEEDEEEIQLPEFDNEAFMKEETRAAKLSFISVGYAIIAGILTFLIYWITGEMWQIALGAGVVLMAGIAGIVYLLKIPFEELNWKNYAGSAFSYLATWMVVLIILINVPFYDGQSPDIHFDRVYTQDSSGNWTQTNESSAVYEHVNNSIVFVITDNREVTKIEFEISRDDILIPNAELTKVDSDKYFSGSEYKRFHGYIYEYFIPANSTVGQYKYTVTAYDAKDHSTSESGQFALILLI